MAGHPQLGGRFGALPIWVGARRRPGGSWGRIRDLVEAVFAGYESYRKLVGNQGTGHQTIGMGGDILGIVGNQAVAWHKA